jgi:transposase
MLPCVDLGLVRVLFPHLGGVRVEVVNVKGSSVRIAASTPGGKMACPGCGTESARVNSGYEQRLSDAAVGGQEVLICLRVRRLFCDNLDCGRKTFAEGWRA